MLLGCIADDFTGASDLANTLARGGMSTMQFIGAQRLPAPDECEAGVVALKIRSVPPGDAMAQGLEALQWLRAQGCRQIMFKYCSTFDSTAAGNIGPVAEALLERLGTNVAVVCPAFPATGRTVYQGHLFVGDKLLNESGMQHHPLNPMPDSDIRRWLSRQAAAPVGWVEHAVVRRGAESIRVALEAEASNGRKLVVVDATTEEDLHAIGAAVKEHLLVTGASGIALGLPGNFRGAGRVRGAAASFPAFHGPGAVLCGSCSSVSLRQVKHYSMRHPFIAVSPADILEGRMNSKQIAAWMTARSGSGPIAFSTTDPEGVRAAQESYGSARVAAAVEAFFGELACALVETGVERLVVGGGETAGAVVSALGVSRLRIGPEIDPGVPALADTRDRPLGLAMKSGNFGVETFFEKALGMLAGDCVAAQS